MIFCFVYAKHSKMLFIIKLLRALALKKKLSQYKNEKRLAQKGLSTLSEKATKHKLREKYKKSFLYKFIKELKKENSLLNFLWKSVAGFFGGVLLTYIFFVFFNIGVNYSLKTAFYICIILGIIFCLGLAFSSKVRCYVLLLIPVFFSKQGRRSLMAYAFFLTLTGPARNILRNMAILSDSMACGQDELKIAARQLYEMIKQPFRSIKETITKITNSVKEVVKSIKEVISSIKRIILGILNVIKTVAEWLGSIVNFCNKKFGTPFQRCMKSLDDAIDDCKAKLGIMDFLCHIVHIVKGLCYAVKVLDLICMFTDFVSDVIVGTVKRKLKEFSLHVKNIFYVSIEFSHSYEMESKASNSTRDIAKSIVKEIRKKVEKVQTIINIANFCLAVFFFLIFIRVYYYRYKYLSSDRYDNCYINKYIIEMDMRRAKTNNETVLPLEPREKKHFTKPTSIKLLKEEKERLFKATFFMIISSVEILSVIAFDYSFNWVLSLIYEAGFREYEKVTVLKSGIHVQGVGIMADFYRKLGNVFKIPEEELRFDPVHCLPNPHPPNYSRYTQIGFLLTICWILTITEAYGLRLRNVVMSEYYPDRARERAVWLYNHILRSRGGFLRFARRQLRRKFQGDESIEKVSFFQALAARFPLLGALFGRKKENACILCGKVETKKEPLKRCKTPDCRGIYCFKCYASLQNICTICQNPIEYGDVSDVSEERDSSDEDLNPQTDDSRTTDYSQDEEPKTFQELEFKDRFRDVESNHPKDFAVKDDFTEDTTTLRRKVKKALKNKIKNLAVNKSEKEELLHEIRKRANKKIYQLESKRYQEKKPGDYTKLLSKAKKIVKKIAKKKEREEDNDLLMDEMHVKGKKPNYKNLIEKLKSRVNNLSRREDDDKGNGKNELTYYFKEYETRPKHKGTVKL